MVWARIGLKQLAQLIIIEIDIALAQEAVDVYRRVHSPVKNFWYALEKAAIDAVRSKQLVKLGKIAFGVAGNFLHCRLPSKRLLSYYNPRIETSHTPWGATVPKLTFMAEHPLNKRWERTSTYGGSICENLCQGIARDLMAEAMLNVEMNGYEVLLSVHDEILAEAPTAYGEAEEFNQLMAMLPAWADGLPIAVEGWKGMRYRK